MKKIFSLLILLTLSMSSFAQKATVVEYELKIESTSEETAMMAGFMDGSSMVIASGGTRTYVKTVFGIMYTMEIETDTETNISTIAMTGMMGDMAFRGDSDELADEEEEKDTPEIEFLKETKTILGYKCKKAISTNENGDVSTFWYTKKIDRPEVSQMPNALPGICLEMSTSAEGMTINYVASLVSESADMNDYVVAIPAGVQVQPLSEMGQMGQ